MSPLQRSLNAKAGIVRFHSLLGSGMNRPTLENCNPANVAERHTAFPYDSEQRPEYSLGNPRQSRVVLYRRVAVFDGFSEPHPYSADARSLAPSTDHNIVGIGPNAPVCRRRPSVRQFLEQHKGHLQRDDSPFSYRLLTASMLLQAARKEFLWQC